MLHGAFTDVVEFMEIAGQDIGQPLVPSPELGIGIFKIVVDDLAAFTSRCRKTAATLQHSDRLKFLSAALMLEELGEALKALAEGHHVEFADGLVDLIYVALGSGVRYGLDLPAVWDAVQRANMAKFKCAGCGGDGWISTGSASGPDPSDDTEPCTPCKGAGYVAIKDASGKVIKPPGWTPPDVAMALAGGDFKGYMRAARTAVASDPHDHLLPVGHLAAGRVVRFTATGRIGSEVENAVNTPQPLIPDLGMLSDGDEDGT